MNTQSVQMVLETNKFRELMREAYELSCIAQQPKYNLQSEESLIEYEKWAPYVLNTGSDRISRVCFSKRWRDSTSNRIL